ncbi:apiosidase-like domain-containing protein [Myxosarcina sp. GI1(2024)]
MRRFFYLHLLLLSLLSLVLVALNHDDNSNTPKTITSKLATIGTDSEASGQSLELELKVPEYPIPTKLKIDSSKRFLVRADDSPFVWIGDTFWKFSKLSREQRLQLLDDRKSKGFNVVMVRVGTGTKGEPAGFTGNLEPIESHFQELDHLVAAANERGMYIAIATGWWYIVRDFDAEALYKFGKFIGDRYKNNDNIIWLGAGESGSHHRKQELAFSKLKSLIRGIRDGDTGNKLLTVHADYQRGTSLSDTNELVDFKNWQTSQWCCPDDLPRQDVRNWTVWEAIAYDYEQLPTKPTFDGEAWFENTNLGGGAPAKPYNIRRRAYFTIFAGGFGHSYGGSGIWDVTSNFSQALQYEGATQIGYLSQLLHALGNDFLKLRPAQSMVISGQSSDYDRHIQATSANDGSYALVYTAGTSNFALDLSQFRTESISAMWFNPRTKELSERNRVGRSSLVNFTTPENGDWVLVLGR